MGPVGVGNVGHCRTKHWLHATSVMRESHPACVAGVVGLQLHIHDGNMCDRQHSAQCRHHALSLRLSSWLPLTHDCWVPRTPTEILLTNRSVDDSFRALFDVAVSVDMQLVGAWSDAVLVRSSTHTHARTHAHTGHSRLRSGDCDSRCAHSSPPISCASPHSRL